MDDDPRFVRPLPWNHLTQRFPLCPSSPIGIFIWLAALSFAVIIVPIGLLRMSLRWRSFRPAALALAWVALVWGGLVAGYWLELNDDAALRIAIGGYRKFIIGVGAEFAAHALVGLPAVAFVAALLSCLVQRRGWRLGLLAGSAVIFSVVAGVTWVRSAGLDDGQRYASSGWWRVAPAGAYAAGLLLVIGRLGQTVWAWRKWRPWRRWRKGASRVSG